MLALLRRLMELDVEGRPALERALRHAERRIAQYPTEDERGVVERVLAGDGAARENLRDQFRVTLVTSRSAGRIEFSRTFDELRVTPSDFVLADAGYELVIENGFLKCLNTERENRMKRLAQFFGGYFHQDFDLDNGTVDGVIDSYIVEAGPTSAQAIGTDLEIWSSEYGDDEIERAFQRELCGDVLPERPVRWWLGKIARKLKSGLLALDEQNLLVTLGRLTSDARLAFAAACAQRALCARTERGDPAAMATALARAWEHLTSARIDDAELAALLERCAELIPDNDKPGQDCALAITYVIEATRSGAVNDAVFSVRHSYEAVVGSVRGTPAHPVVQAELARQRTDLNDLIPNHPGDAALWRVLRDRARRLRSDGLPDC
ncbi:MAG TPA: contact-dependent growth inhibition system immunity protein [Kofleriaceae bacterium]